MEQKTVFKIGKMSFEAVIFDMDGVITRTAKTHAAAWENLFEEYLREICCRKGIQYRPFSEDDYRRYVDGKSRFDGLKSFIDSHGIDIPLWGDVNDPPGHETICALGNKKNILFQDQI
jgi:trehalose 6-phosphate phosphatase